MSWNVLHVDGGVECDKKAADFLRWKNRFETIRLTIQSVDPDILALQELNAVGDWGSATCPEGMSSADEVEAMMERQLRELLPDHGLCRYGGDWLFYRNSRLVPWGQGANHPPDCHPNLLEGITARHGVWARLRYVPGPQYDMGLIATSVHLKANIEGDNAPQRLTEILRIRGTLHDFGPLSTDYLVMGDMNIDWDDKTSPTGKRLMQCFTAFIPHVFKLEDTCRDSEDCDRDATLISKQWKKGEPEPHKKDKRRIDYILTSENLKVESMRVLSELPSGAEYWGSDHLPVVATVRGNVSEHDGDEATVSGSMSACTP